MKYIIMCGGTYKDFKTPKQLLKVNGEVLVERTIRLLKENGITDIAISTNNPAFDYLDVPIYHHNNKFISCGKQETKKSEFSWLNAYYPTDEPCCYLHGDVYFSDEAIQKIINTEVEDTMFFCTFDKTDGKTHPLNWKGREPFAYKVQNQAVFRYAIKKLLKMVDKGLYDGSLPPISWHLYRFLNGYDVKIYATKYTEVNNIFQTIGDYKVINDYTTDIDKLEDITNIEKIMEDKK